MAEINLGDFPFYGGVKIEDLSIYIGNNRFFRLVTQSDNDSTIGVVYETSDVFDNNASTTQVCSEVLYAGISHTDIKMTVLGDGRIAVFAKRYGTNDYYVFTVEYDDVNNTFIKSDTIYLSSGDMNSSSGNLITLHPYEQNTVFLIANDDYTGSAFMKFVFGTETVTTTRINYMSNSIYYDPPYPYSSGQSINIVDDNVYIRNTSYSYSLNHVYNITSDNFDTNFYSYYPNVCKLSENKYVIVRYQDNTATLQYRLLNTLPSRADIENSTYNSFIPTISSVTDISGDVGRQLETFKLDDQHMIIFDKAGNDNPSEDNNIYMRVVKIVDENYAFSSDNSNGQNGVLLTSNYSGVYTTMSNFYDGKLVKRVDDQRFYIQTSANSYEFFTLTT